MNRRRFIGLSKYVALVVVCVLLLLQTLAVAAALPSVGGGSSDSGATALPERFVLGETSSAGVSALAEGSSALAVPTGEDSAFPAPGMVGMVPYLYQGNTNKCGAYALQEVLWWYGRTDITQADIESYLGKSEGPYYIWELYDAFIHFLANDGDPSSVWADYRGFDDAGQAQQWVKDRLFQGIPVICCVQAPQPWYNVFGYCNHYVTIVGWDDTLGWWYVNDTSGALAYDCDVPNDEGYCTGADAAVPYDLFDQYWDNYWGYPPETWHGTRGVVAACPGDNYKPDPRAGIYTLQGGSYVSGLPDIALNQPLTLYVCLANLFPPGGSGQDVGFQSQGAFFRFENAEIVSADIGGAEPAWTPFTSLQTYDEQGNAIPVAGAKIVEFYKNESLMPSNNTAWGHITIRPTAIGTMTVRYRGWIMDPDDIVREDPITINDSRADLLATTLAENVIVRYPADSQNDRDNFLDYPTEEMHCAVLSPHLGDVFISYGGTSLRSIRRCSNSNLGLIQVINDGVSSYRTAFDTAGNLYAIIATADEPNGIKKFDSWGNFLGNFGYDPTHVMWHHPAEMVRDALGNWYVCQEDGSPSLMKFDSSGYCQAQWDPAGESGSGVAGITNIDLAADQHTLFYTAGGYYVKRFDVATGKQLPDFAYLHKPYGPLESPYHLGALRILPSGDLLVVAGTQVLRLDNQEGSPTRGCAVQFYSVGAQSALTELSLDPNGTSFWTAEALTGNVYKVNIATELVEFSFITSGYLNCLRGLSVGGEPRAAQVSNTAPAVNAGPDATINEGGTFSSSGSFTDPDTDTWTATVDYDDGSGVQPIGLTDKAFALSHAYAAAGVYTVTVTVSDDGGGVGTDTAVVAVTNTPPAVNAGPDATINEGGTFGSSGSFIDPDADTWTATVDYGDGSGVQPLGLTGKTFALNHVYADSGTYAVAVSVTDDNGNTGSDTAQVNVSNVAPTVDAGPDQTAECGMQTLSFSGSFTDPGWLDTHTIHWDFGDGATVDGSLNVSHLYTTCGAYTVTLTVTDDDGGVGVDTTAVTVIDATPPSVAMVNPPAGYALQDGVTFVASAIDAGSGIAAVTFSIREDNSGAGTPIGYEDILGIYDPDMGPPATGAWTLLFDTLQVPDGFYVVVVKATDNAGNAGSVTVPYSIRNWAVLGLLPATANNKAGRTMPIRFSLRVSAAVDPAQPFVYNESLTIKILGGGNLLQTSTFGTTSQDYRIDAVTEQYITNFKTLDTPMEYTVQVWRGSMLIDHFSFETTRSKTSSALLTAGVSSIPYLGYILAGLLGCFVIAVGLFTFYMWGRPLPTRR